MNSYKKYSFVVIVLLMFSSAYSAYLKNVPKKITQPDGTIIHCFATGDEYYNWLHDSAGFTIVKDLQSGYFVYATLLDQELIPSKYIVGTVNPNSVGLSPNINISEETYQAKRDAILDYLPKVNTHKKAEKKHEGLINNLAFFIRFDDDSTHAFQMPFSTMDTMFNDSSSSDANSMYNYYRTVSYNNLRVKTYFYPAANGDTILSFQDSFPRDYYRPYHATTNPIGYTELTKLGRRNALLVRAVKFFKDSIDNSLNLDFNQDGKVDNICFVITGDADDWNDLLWPHRSVLISNDSINGVAVRDYNLQLESHSNPGVISHEMMHTLGAPDLYRYSGSFQPVGSWCLMGSTDYNAPQGMSAYIKYQYGGWTDSIIELKEPGTYTLYPANGNSPEKTAYMFRPNNNSREYIILEYRSTNSNIFESNLKSGLLMYSINENFKGQGSMYYNGTNRFDEVFILRPDNGTYTTNSHFAADYNRTECTPLTSPYPIYTNGKPMGGFLITDITNVGDSIQFTFNKQNDTINISTDEIILDCKKGQIVNFDITSNIQWKMNNSQTNFINISTEIYGKGNRSIPIRANADNDGTTTKTCTLSVYTLGDVLCGRIIVKQSPCTGIEKISQDDEINVFPNPANEVLNVVYPKTDEDYTVSIYSITGQLLYSSTAEGNNNQTSINVASLPSGIYYMRFYSQKQSIVKSFTIK